MANEQLPVMGSQPRYVPPVPPGQTPEVTVSETYSREILGYVEFELRDLRVQGDVGGPPPYPMQSGSIIRPDEPFKASVQVNFNNSPLTRLLMCIGTTVKVTFSFEGIGATANDKDLVASIITREGVLNYLVELTSTANAEGLNPGFYAIAAVAEVGPVTHACGQFVLGFGYIAKALLQIHPAYS